MKKIVLVFLSLSVLGAGPLGAVSEVTIAFRDTFLNLNSGDSPVFPDPIFNAGVSPSALAIGDFNNDGAEDFAVASLGPAGLSVLLGIGNGTFGPETRFDAGDFSTSLEVGDLNKDGADDIVLANGGSNDISVLLGSGDGRFDSEMRFEVGISPSSVELRDFNGDDALDIVTANFGSNDLSVILGDGHGGFGPDSRVTVGTAPRTVDSADLNGDGTADLIVADRGNCDEDCTGGSITVLLGNGDGTFALQSSIVINGVPASVALDDFDHDDIPDLVVGNEFPNGLSVFLGTGDGSFPIEDQVAAGTGVSSIAAWDFNRDGMKDLSMVGVDVSGRRSGVSILLGNGDGTFESGVSLDAGHGPLAVRVGEFNSDTIADLAIIVNANGVTVLLGVGDGSFGPQLRFPAGETAFSVAIDYLDEDADLDLVVTNFGSGDISVLLGNGDGTFTSEVRFAVGDRPASVAVGDFNDDGLQDLAIANHGGSPTNLGDVSVLLGLGGGLFGPEVRVQAGDGPNSIAAADVSRDEKTDLVVANRGSDDISVLLGNGDGTFSPEIRFSVGNLPVFIAVGDFNHDGDADVATANGFSDDVSVLLGHGDGSFATQTRFDGGFDPWSVAVVDINMDGGEDLAVANANSDDLSLLLGRGDGTFEPEIRWAVGNTPLDVAAADLNSDGNMDLATANRNEGDVSVLLGNGDGTFAPHARFVAGFGPASLAIGDLDTNGLADIVVAGPLGIAVLINQGAVPNRPPHAEAGLDQEIECQGNLQSAVLLDGSLSTDPDSAPGTSDDIVSFEWFEDLGLPAQTLLGSGEVLSLTLPLGSHVITLRVTDTAGVIDTDEVIKTVADTTPPVIAASIAPPMLWPPNHRIVDVAALVSVSDLCSSPSVVLQSVTSSEPDDDLGAGDGSTVDDIQGAEAGAPDIAFQLRAERSGAGDGRTYSATYRVTDSSGNSATATASAVVPHSVNDMTEPLPIVVHENSTGTVVQWFDVQVALFYNVVRGKIGNMHEREGSFHLGQLTCIATATTETNTVGSEDPEVPRLGEAFFYLAEYYDGLLSGYGTESAAKERFVAPGQANCP